MVRPPATRRGGRIGWFAMGGISGFFSWLFGSKAGVLTLLGCGVVFFLILAWRMEKKTRKEYFNHEKSEDDWDLFDDDDEDE